MKMLRSRGLREKTVLDKFQGIEQGWACLAEFTTGPGDFQFLFPQVIINVMDRQIMYLGSCDHFVS